MWPTPLLLFCPPTQAVDCRSAEVVHMISPFCRILTRVDAAFATLSALFWHVLGANMFLIRLIQRSAKRRGCLLSYSQAEPGRELTQPSLRLLAEPRICVLSDNIDLIWTNMWQTIAKIWVLLNSHLSHQIKDHSWFVNTIPAELWPAEYKWLIWTQSWCPTSRATANLFNTLE